MIKHTTIWPVLIYGLLMITLGYIGYQQRGSHISLYMGGGFGLLLVASSILMFYRPKMGSYAALILTLGLTATFAVRYFIAGKGFSAILTLISAGMLLFLLVRAVQWKR